MTITIDETTTTAPTGDDDAIYVLDMAGLEALPVGTNIKEESGDVTFVGHNHSVSYDLDKAQDPEYTGISFHAVYLPARVLNPEILGTFTPEPAMPTEVGQRVVVIDNSGSYKASVGDEGTVTSIAPSAWRTGTNLVRVKLDRDEVELSMFDFRFRVIEQAELKAGDTVEIMRAVIGDWIGFRGVVSSWPGPYGASYGKLWIEPLSPRPDGRQWNGFYWSANDLRKVEAVDAWVGLRKGDRVLVIDPTGDTGRAVEGVYGTVISGGEVGHLIKVEQDLDFGTTHMLGHRFSLAGSIEYIEGDRVYKIGDEHRVSGSSFDYGNGEAEKGEFGTVRGDRSLGGSLYVKWDRSGRVSAIAPEYVAPLAPNVEDLLSERRAEQERAERIEAIADGDVLPANELDLLAEGSVLMIHSDGLKVLHKA